MKKQELKKYVMEEVKSMCDNDDVRVVYLYKEIRRLQITEQIKGLNNEMNEYQRQHLKLKYPHNKTSPYIPMQMEIRKKIDELRKELKNIDIKKLKKSFEL